jgi:trans-aconitate 2-methyltransferase
MSSIKGAYNWDAADYASHSSAQRAWARELIDKLKLRGHEDVLDLGCGSGDVTAWLAETVPRGAVTGIDSSADMIALAKRNFPPDKYPHLNFRQLDVRNLDYQESFDIVFSNAVLHWIHDHQPVLDGISRSLRPGGKTLLQMGGRGNAADMVAIMNILIQEDSWKSYFREFTFPYAFYAPAEYRSWLAAAGLEAERVELIPKDMSHDGPGGLAGWIRTTWLPYVSRIPEIQRDAFIDDVVSHYSDENPLDEDGRSHVKMIRLEVEARKSRP